MAEERLAVGLVRGLHGLDGAVRVEVLTDDLARFKPGSVVHLEGRPEPLTVAWSQADRPGGLLVRFDEVRSREAAEPLRDRYLEAEAAPDALAGDEVWWHEVIGVPVTTAAGELLGQVAEVFRAGGSEVYVVRGGPRGEVLVPAVRSVVAEFAPRQGRIVVDAAALDLGQAPPRRPRGRRSSKAGVPAVRSAGPGRADAAVDPAAEEATAGRITPEPTGGATAGRITPEPTGGATAPPAPPMPGARG